jgi:hypothetical protein
MTDVTVRLTVSKRSRLAAAFALEAIAKAVREDDLAGLPHQLTIDGSGIQLDVPQKD